MSPLRPESQGSRAAAVVFRVLWASFPVWSFGLLGWVPSLRVAIRRRTAAAWCWFGVFATALIVEFTFAATAPADPKNPKQTVMSWWVALFIFAYIIAATVHGWVSSRDLPRRSGGRPVQPSAPAWGAYGQTVAMQPPAAGLPPVQPSYGYGPGPQPQTLSQPQPQRTAPLDSTAAEVQAELRELRGILGESGQDHL